MLKGNKLERDHPTLLLLFSLRGHHPHITDWIMGLEQCGLFSRSGEASVRLSLALLDMAGKGAKMKI